MPKYLDETGLAHLWGKIEENAGHGVSFECGASESDVYTILTVPKSLFEVSLELVSGSTSETATIREYALKQRPYLCMNISNTGNFVHNGTLYGIDETVSVHGAIYGLKSGGTDFIIYPDGSTLADAITDGCIDAIGGWAYLRKDGVDNPNQDFSYDTFSRPNPRQVLAWDSDNWYIYTSYGRISHVGRDATKNWYGLTLSEILAFCTSRGWPNVAHFDGGGSIFVASGQPYRQLSVCLNNAYYRSAYMCVAFNLKEES